MKYELLFDGTLGDWRTQPVSFKLREGVSPYHCQAFQYKKYTKTPSSKKLRGCVNWGY
jgi:hypothetical protein